IELRPARAGARIVDVQDGARHRAEFARVGAVRLARFDVVRRYAEVSVEEGICASGETLVPACAVRRKVTALVTIDP
ncbi:hypothetical protein HC928_22650, partial [bacterium]|nr:hypothetical protein [bacterium]